MTKHRQWSIKVKAKGTYSIWGQVCSLWHSQFSHSVMSDSLRPHGLQHTRPPCLSPTHEFTQTHVHWGGDVIPPSHPLSFPPPTFNLPQHQGLFQWLFASGGQSIGASASASVGCSGLMSFRMDWLELLAVQGTLKSLLQHHSSKASILRRSTFFSLCHK